jgi:hypothetical protein
MATVKQKIGVLKERATAGLQNDLIELISDAYFEQGLSLEESFEAVKDQLIQKAVDRFEPKIRAALGRAGLQLPDGPLSLDVIKQGIIEKTGLELSDLTPDALYRAVDGGMAAKLSEAAGVPIASILSGPGIKASIEAGIKQSLANGTASALLSSALSKRARVVATWNREGAGIDQKKAMRAWYQKKYRKTHKEVWV